jgi:hypothetical protein
MRQAYRRLERRGSVGQAPALVPAPSHRFLKATDSISRRRVKGKKKL